MRGGSMEKTITFAFAPYSFLRSPKKNRGRKKGTRGLVPPPGPLQAAETAHPSALLEFAVGIRHKNRYHHAVKHYPFR